MKFRVLMAVAAIPAIATIGICANTDTTPPTEPSATTTPAPAPRQRPQRPKRPQRPRSGISASRTSGARASWSVQKSKTTPDETIGDINEIVLTSDGAAAAAIIGVGGFLGMGEREVAVQFKSLHISKDSSGNDVVKLDTTKDASEECSGLDVAEQLTQYFFPGVRHDRAARFWQLDRRFLLKPRPRAFKKNAWRNSEMQSETTMLETSKVPGTSVYSGAQEEIGAVDDLIVDTVSGKVRYAILSFGGFLGLEKVSTSSRGPHSSGTHR